MRVWAARCNDRRPAGATIDLDHERANRARGPRIHCPTPLRWSASGMTTRFFDPLAVWPRWAEEVRSAALPCGHCLMEEAPEQVTAQRSGFLRAVRERDPRIDRTPA
jgi:haloacetate dehalogenase